MSAVITCPTAPVQTNASSNKLFAELSDYAKRVIEVTAQNIAERPDFSLSDFPDIKQQLTIHVARHAQRFDGARGQESTFIARVVKNKAASIVRGNNTRLRRLERAAASIHAEVKDDFGDLVERHELLPDTSAPHREEVRIEVNDVLATLPPRLKVVAEMLMKDGVCGVARELGLERHEFTAGVLRELRDAFEKGGFDPETFKNRNGKRSACVKMQ